MTIASAALRAARPLLKIETLTILMLTVALLVSYMVLRDEGPFQAFEGQTLDWRFRMRGAHEPASDIVIVAIDEKTLNQLGRWPFSREWLARVVDRLDRAGARTIAFDLLLTGSGPARVKPFWPNPALLASGDQGERLSSTADLALTQAIDRAGNVVVPFAFTFDHTTGNAADLPDTVRKSAFRIVQVASGDTVRAEPVAIGALLPQSPFLAAGYPAHVSVLLEADGSVRFAHPAIRFGDAYYPSAAVEIGRLFLRMAPGDMALRVGKSISLDGHEVLLDGHTAMPINFAGPEGSFPQYSLSDVLTGEVDGGKFRDKLVLIGATASGLGDRFDSPFSLRLPGVELVATMIDNVLLSRPLQRGAVAMRVDLAAILLAGLLTVPLILLNRLAFGLLAFASLVAAWAVICGVAFSAHSLWLNATFPLLALIGGSGIAIAGAHVRDYRLRILAERQQQRLSHYVSPLTAVGLAAGGVVDTQSREQDAAVMFIDLVGYTRTSEQLTEDAAARMLREFHQLVETKVASFGGAIDKFMGDGALIVFGVPDPGPEDSANAIACAMSLACALDQRNRVLSGTEAPRVICSFGIHFGTVMLVELGGREHRQFTVTGGTVNIASRLEALTRTFGATIIISDAVAGAARRAGRADLVSGFDRLPPQQLRGRSDQIDLWAWRSGDEVAPANQR
jgi:adenylate cyclase